MGSTHHHTHDHSNGHGHDHSHGGHAHIPAGTSRRKLGLAALLTGAFMIAEVIGGLISGSLALLADAGHMLTDFVALAMAWGAFAIMARGSSEKLTFGWDRVSILVAFVNGLTLFAVAAWIVLEAVERFRDPGEVLAGPMLGVAIAGLAINVLVFWILVGANRENLNVRGAMLHVIGDMLGSVAAIVAAIIILLSGWTLADPLLSVIVALIILRSAWGLVREAAHILLEGAPPGMEADVIAASIKTHVRGVDAVNHIHAWSITPDRPIVSLEAWIAREADRETVRSAIKAHLQGTYNVDHATIEVMSTQTRAENIVL